MLREFLLSTNQGALNVAEGPDNGPLLLLLHGFTNRWQVFQPILPALTPDWHVVTFDFRGHGRSAHVADGYTAAGFYADAAAVLESLGAAPAYLLGHSMGGSLALHLAQNYADRVRAVVIGDTSLNLAIHVNVMNNRRNTKLFGLRRKLAGRPVDELIRRGLLPEAAEEMSQLDPAVMDFHAEGRVEGFFADIFDVDFENIHCPLLITQADPARGGLLQDVEIAPVLSAHPQFQFARFESGHDLEIEKGPDSAFFQRALEFIKRVCGKDKGPMATVTFDETLVECHRSDGTVERVRWDELRSVIIRTTADGPFSLDVYWVLVGRQSGCVVPAEATGEGELLERLQKLPGFDNAAFIEAMRCVEERNFICWQKTP